MIPQAFSARVDAYLHGLLDAAEAAEVERLAAASPEWAAALEDGRRRMAALASLPQSEASEALVRGTIDGIEKKSIRRRKWFFRYAATLLTMTTAAVVTLAAMNWHYHSLWASPVDLRVFGQNQLLAGSNASLRISLLHANTRAPLASVPVQMFLINTTTKEKVRLADFPTDVRGSASPRFSLPDWPSGQYQISLVAQTDKGPEELTQLITLKRESKLMLSSDKPLYQPGQTIHLRSLALRRPDLKPIDAAETLFSIADPQGNVIFKKKAPSSRFGIAAADCPLATEILEGPYQVTCRVGDTESQLTLNVEKYVLPKFKVALTLDRPYYQPGQTVKGKVQADYFFGKPVSGGKVEILAQTTDVEVSNISQSDIDITNDGDVEFDFTLPDHFVGREQTGGDARFQVVATVIDSAGQKHAVSESRTVTTQPIRVEVLPESSPLLKLVPNKVYVLATYADGRPAKTKVTVNDQHLETNDLGIGSLELKPDGPQIGLTVAATDAEGLTGRRHVTLFCDAGDLNFLLLTDKAVYRGGETIHVKALGGMMQPVFVDILKDKQTLLTQVIEMSLPNDANVGGVAPAGRGETAIDLPADCFGTIELYAYRYDHNGLPSMKTRTLFVEPPSQLKIAVERDADVYRPGGTAKLSFTLTDESGKPTPGALSLAAVDEAVFHVLKQRPGLESTFFNLEKELLEPVYAIYPWSPFAYGVPADQEQLARRDELERAIFSRTARPVQQTTFGNHAGGAGFGAMPGGMGIDLGDAAPGVEMFGMAGDVAVAPAAVKIDTVPPVPSPITLAVNTYPAKVQAVQQQRQAGFDRVRSGGRWLVGLFALSVIGGFAAFKPKAFAITAGVFLCLGGLAYGSLHVLWSVSPQSAAKFGAAMPPGARAMVFAAGGDKSEVWDMATPMAAAEGMPAEGMMGGLGGGGAPESPVRVRRQFPETLLWQPQLITDDAGKATLELPLADSITNWRLTASAVSASGQLGALQDGVRVFQPFFVDLNLPVALTRNDEVGIPVVVYNYLSEPQTVEIVLERDEWFELLDGMGAAATEGAAEAELPEGIANPQAAKREGAPLSVKVELKANEIRSMSFRIRASQVGLHSLQATARSVTQPGVADALRRDIAVEPDGRKVELVQNGSLAEPVELAVTVPEEAIPGSAKLLVKLYPSSFSQLVEGLDAIFQRPYGCFEQTSSTTYPNILALDYLRSTKKSVPEVEAKARQYIHLGYQRLISFEVTENGARGGFDWFGNPPANQTLSAYGLLEFTDMAKVHDVDPELINRTRDWLLHRRQADGSWKADIGMLNDGLAGSIQRGKDLDLATTAYVAWGVFGGGSAKPQAGLTLNYLLAHDSSSIESPYVLAMVANAVAAIDPQNAAVKPFLARLDSLKKTDESGKKSWWELPEQAQTCFYSSGQSGNIEVTALATLAMLEAKQFPVTVNHALTWLVEQKDAQGTWHSTQATILALKALIKGTTAAIGGDKERVIDVLVDGEVVQTITVAPDQSDVMQQLNLSAKFASGSHSLKLVEKTDTGTGYQVTFRHHVPGSEFLDKGPGPLKIDLAYDKTTLAVNDFVTATAAVTNTMAEEAPMVILDLPVPAGFRMATDTLEELVAGQKIAKFQQNARSTVVYLRTLKPGDTLTVNYRLEATMPVKLTVPAAVAYEYYNPAKRGTGQPVELVVNPK